MCENSVKNPRETGESSFARDMVSVFSFLVSVFRFRIFHVRACEKSGILSGFDVKQPIAVQIRNPLKGFYLGADFIWNPLIGDFIWEWPR